jgi:hypothetical protein
MADNDNDRVFRTGAQLLADFECRTREQKLERACIALLGALDDLHVRHEHQSLEQNLTNQKIVCSCADAYRMGNAAVLTALPG